MKYFAVTFFSLLTLQLSACATRPPMPTVEYLDVDRFMGKWYVIASIPTMFEKNIVNAVESYERIDDRKIQTTFTFQKNNTEGDHGAMHPVGYISDDPSNAIWKMQFIWPFKADYRVAHVGANYQTTIIAREKRDYVWIMARSPSLPESQYQTLVNKVEKLGYDSNRLIKVPQLWEAKQ